MSGPAADSDVFVVHETRADVGEGPSWDAASDSLLFVDITPGIVYRHSPATGSTTAVRFGQEIGAAIPRAGGGVVLAARDGIGFGDETSGTIEWLAPIEADRPGNRMNDAKCDPSGRLWAGTMAFDFAEGAAALYRIDADGSYEQVLRNATISNGLGWSPDGATMYFIDSGPRRLDVFDFDAATGTALDRRTLIAFGEDDGMPDGMTVDGEGCLWVAFFGSGCVRRYSPTGRRLSTITVPASQVTSCCFGGADLRTLYITTARYAMDAAALDAEPLAGATFASEPDVTGLPTTAFAG